MAAALLLLEYLRGEHRSLQVTGVQTPNRVELMVVGSRGWWAGGGTILVPEAGGPCQAGLWLSSLGEQFHWCTCEISVDLPPGRRAPVTLFRRENIVS